MVAMPFKSLSVDLFEVNLCNKNFIAQLVF